MTTFTIPEGTAATLETVAAAATDALAKLEKLVLARGQKPVWDTVEIAIETEFMDTQTLGGDTTRHRINSGAVSVLAIDPEEIS